MIDKDERSENFQDLPAPPDTELDCQMNCAELYLSDAKLQQYIALLRLDDVERTQILNTVAGRICTEKNGNGSLQRPRSVSEARALFLQELHRHLASPTGSLPAPGSEELTLWRSAKLRAAVWTTCSSREKHLSLENLTVTPNDPPLSLPPLRRRRMVPKRIEYISWRGIWDGLRLMLPGKVAPATFSLPEK